jgi:hypothetical protein
MATTTQVIRNRLQSTYVIKIEGDDASTTTIDASDANTNMPEDGTATLNRVMWTQGSGDITITWKGTGADAIALRLSGNGNMNFIQNPPVIPNNATTPTGDVTVVKATAAKFSIILEFGTGGVSDPTAV